MGSSVDIFSTLVVSNNRSVGEGKATVCRVIGFNLSSVGGKGFFSITSLGVSSSSSGKGLVGTGGGGKSSGISWKFQIENEFLYYILKF